MDKIVEFIPEIVFAIISSVIYYIFYSLTIIPITIFQSISGLGLYQADLLLKDLGTPHFDLNPVRTPRRSATEELGRTIQMFFKAIGNIFWGNVRNLAPILIAAPYLVVVSFWFSIAIFFLWSLTPSIFLIVDVVWRGYFIWATVVTFWINQILALCWGNSQLISDLIDFIISLGTGVARTICIKGTGNDLNEQCLYSILARIFQHSWTTFFSTFQLLLDAVSICPPVLCLKLFGSSLPCSWNLNFAVRLGVDLFNELGIFLVYSTKLIYLSIRDLFTAFLFEYHTLLASVPSDISSIIIGLSTQGSTLGTLATTNVPTSMEPLRAGLRATNGFFVSLIHISGYLFKNLGFILDIINCNVIIAPIKCGVYKICASAFQTYWIPITIGALPTTYVPFDFYYYICEVGLGLTTLGCVEICDACSGNPFGFITASSRMFERTNVFYGGEPARYLPLIYGPCNLAGSCCRVQYSLVYLVLVFFPFSYL